MGWKETVENNIIVIVTCTAISAVTVGGGVVGYLANESRKIAEASHDHQITILEAELQSQIDSLVRKMSSIERKTASGDAYFDVTLLMAPPSKLRSLPKEYKFFEVGNIYVAPIDDDNWEYSLTSQLERASRIFGKDFIESLFPAQMRDVLSEKNMLSWKFNDTVNISADTFIGNIDARFSPEIVVMHFDYEYIKRIGQSFSVAIEEELEGINSRSNLNKLSEMLEGVEKERKLYNQQDSDDEQGKEILSFASNNFESKLTVDMVQRSIEATSNAFGADLAGFVLIDKLLSNFQLTSLFGGRIEIETAEKKGNVLYLATRIVIPNVVSSDESEEYLPLIIHEEIFYIGLPDKGTFVTISVPSTDFRNSAYLWTQSWLSSLRVPVKY